MAAKRLDKNIQYTMQKIVGTERMLPGNEFQVRCLEWEKACSSNLFYYQKDAEFASETMRRFHSNEYGNSFSNIIYQMHDVEFPSVDYQHGGINLNVITLKFTWRLLLYSSGSIKSFGFRI